MKIEQECLALFVSVKRHNNPGLTFHLLQKGVKAQGAKGKGQKKDIKLKGGFGGKIRGARLFKTRRGCSPQRLQGEILGHSDGGIFSEQQSPLLTRKHNCEPTFSTFSGRCARHRTNPTQPPLVQVQSSEVNALFHLKVNWFLAP